MKSGLLLHLVVLLVLTLTLCFAQGCYGPPPPAQGLACQSTEDCWGDLFCIGGRCLADGSVEKEPAVADSDAGSTPEPSEQSTKETEPTSTEERLDAGEQSSEGEPQTDTEPQADTEPGAEKEAGNEEEPLPEGSCVPGRSQACYTGPSGTEGQGICRAGRQFCNDKGEWSVCLGETKPGTEVCDGKDNDCDGVADPPEQCACQNGEQRNCYSGAEGCTQQPDGSFQCTAPCSTGIQICQNNQWGACQGEQQPQPETCDGQDNNCDGQIDENLKQSCYGGPAGTEGTGICKAGTQTCQNGAWDTCTGEVKPTTELCDGIDNDCDGTVDEADANCKCTAGQTQACGSDTGDCKKGTQTCDINGQWGACVGEIKPSPETCDGQDNDCDGSIDEEWPTKGAACTVGLGACQRTGTNVCTADNTNVVCSVTPGVPSAEVCDGQDNNCDGQIDENLTRGCYDPQKTGCSLKDGIYNCSGECQSGTQTCQNGTWGACTGAVYPTAEVCDNKDNDCDKAFDENLTQTCSGPCGAGTATCQNGSWSGCQGETPKTEICNGKDDDCDGSVDETFDEQGKACKDTTRNGECQRGTYTACTAGKLTCTSNTTPVTEICANNRDDDCDGQTDEAACRFPTSANLHDIAVMPNGSVFALYQTRYDSTARKYQVEAGCYDKSGQSIRPTFLVGTTRYSTYATMVVSSPTYNTVIWADYDSTGYVIKFQRFNAQCTSVGAVVQFPMYSSGYGHFDASTDKNDNLVIAYAKSYYGLYLRYYSGNNTLLREVAASTSTCYPYGYRISLNPSGAGIFSCQSTTLYYRRLTASRTFLDATLIEVPETRANLNVYYHHINGINDDGNFAFEWHDRSDRFHAKTYSSNGTALRTISNLPPQKLNDLQNPFRATHNFIATLNKTFIYHDHSTATNGLTTWSRYDNNGTLTSLAQQSHASHSLRMLASTSYTFQGRYIYIGALDFGSQAGICSTNQPCLCTPNEVRSCYAGGSRPPTISPCQEGIAQCETSGLGWGSCKNQIIPITEICGNNIDDDCDGQTDEECNQANLFDLVAVKDYDVDTNGNFAIAYTQDAYNTGSLHRSTYLRGACFAANGTAKGSPFVVQISSNIQEPTIRFARNGNFLLFVWTATASNGAPRNYARVYNASCQPVSNTIPLSGKIPTSTNRDSAIANNGNFAIIYPSQTDSNRLRMSLFKSDGTAIQKDLDPDPNRRCPAQSTTATLGMHIALNPTTGAGVFTCQSYSTSPLYYRLFDAAGTLAGTDLVMVRSSDSSKSSYYDTHIVGMNTQGQFVIEWVDRYNLLYRANFYDANGALKQQITLPHQSYNTNTFNKIHQSVELYNDDFVLRTGNRATDVTWYRFKPDGTPAAAATSTEYDPYSLRVGGNVTFALRKGQLQRNALDLSDGKGLCNGKICYCIPGTVRSCSNSGSTRAPCKQGSQTCASDGSGWGSCIGEILPQPEICNQKDDDCDGTVDENCPLTKAFQPLSPLDDYDTAADGTTVTLKTTYKALLANCFKPDGSVKKATFAVSEAGNLLQYPGNIIRYPSVKISQNGKFILFSWMQETGATTSTYRIYSRLYDGDCNPLTKDLSWSTTKTLNGGYRFDTSINDTGTFALLYRYPNDKSPTLAIYNNQGVRQSTSIVDPSNTLCLYYQYGMKIVLHPTSGGGIVSCQNVWSRPINFRLLNSSYQLTGTGMRTVAESSFNANAYHRTHITGMNAKGHFVIQWFDRTNLRLRANVYDNTARLLKNITLKSYRGVLSTQLFDNRGIRDKVNILGDKYILRDDDPTSSVPSNWYLINNLTGAIEKKTSNTTAYAPSSLRVGVGISHIVTTGAHTIIHINPFSF